MTGEPGAPPGHGVYLHVPFCRHRCDYCAFATWSDRDGLIGRYMAACRADAARLAPLLPPVTSVFVGGGTPTRVAPELIGRVVAELPLGPDAEVTVEANPEDLDVARAGGLRVAGATRISIGVQSVVPHVLRALGRRHDPESVPRAVAAARSVGLAVGLDLIYGAAGETVADWAASVDAVLALRPDHVSAYALTVEQGTPLGAARDRHPDDDDQADKYELVTERVEAAGFEWYEISNWARPGQRCVHNVLYWTMGEYTAIGCAAHGHRNGRRSWNVRSPERYIDAIEAGVDPTAGDEVLDRDARRREARQLSLRTDRGIPVEALAPGDRSELAALLEASGDRLVLSRSGRLLANEVALRLR